MKCFIVCSPGARLIQDKTKAELSIKKLEKIRRAELLFFQLYFSNRKKMIFVIKNAQSLKKKSSQKPKLVIKFTI